MSAIVLFGEKQVRRVWNDREQKWYFSVQDVVEILTGSADVKQYVKRLRSRDPELSANWGTICTPVEMLAADGKKRRIQGANIEGLLRIIQSIPSPKAEPFKRWLAKVGYDQLSEKIGQLKMQSADGKLYATDCANTETLFRIIQSIPSPKVEPLKRRLARDLLQAARQQITKDWWDLKRDRHELFVSQVVPPRASWVLSSRSSNSKGLTM